MSEDTNVEATEEVVETPEAEAPQEAPVEGETAPTAN